MEFIETTGFSRIRENYFDDSQFNMLQLFLMDRPDAGDIVKGSGGVRKLRWGQRGQSKRGGVRVICYWITKDNQILFLTAYAKTEARDLSREAIRAMHEIVKNL
ncbi:MAG: type II toxin-antitoxin system RelE/ParE family toxin [Woeseia sp.]|nr:type II toxin-antitoxin system RelE/ParE family toxin [Woeseia sp.]